MRFWKRWNQQDWGHAVQKKAQTPSSFWLTIRTRGKIHISIHIGGWSGGVWHVSSWRQGFQRGNGSRGEGTNLWRATGMGQETCARRQGLKQPREGTGQNRRGGQWGSKSSQKKYGASSGGWQMGGGVGGSASTHHQLGHSRGGGDIPQGQTVRSACLPFQDKGLRGREPVISFHRISQRPTGQFNFQTRWQCKLMSMNVSKL